MLKFLKPKSTIEQATVKGTDIAYNGRFYETLTINHFTTEDEKNLLEIKKILEDVYADVVLLFKNFIGEKISTQLVDTYVEQFFLHKRNKIYVDSRVSFFHLLKKEKINAGALIVMFNRVQFYLTTNLLSKKALQPKKCMALLESLHRAITIEEQLFVEVYLEILMEQTAKGIGIVMQKNADIVHIKSLLENIDEQNYEIQEVSAAAEEITSSIAEVAESAVKVSEKANDYLDKVEQGKEAIATALDEIIQTGATFADIIENFEQLQININTIEDIVKIINDIANQTNLLALNASIEAARAGEHGKGFAVVAQEVRKLAENTVASLHKVNENVKSLRDFSSSVSESINSTSNKVNEATEEAKEAMPILNEIIHIIQDINMDTNHTAAITQQQASSIEEISNRIQAIANISENVRRLGKDTGGAIHELSKVTDEYRTEIIQQNSDITLTTQALLHLSKTDHILWKWRIYNMFIGFEQIDENSVASHKECRLGKWYFAEETKARFRNMPRYEELDIHHEKVHQHAKNAVAALNQNNHSVAQEQLNKLEDASEKVLAILDELLADISKERQNIIKKK